jgi:hypothetical protein
MSIFSPFKCYTLLENTEICKFSHKASGYNAMGNFLLQAVVVYGCSMLKDQLTCRPTHVTVVVSDAGN